MSFLQSGVLSALPFVAASTCTILGGQLADFLLSRNLLRLITVRKLFSSLGEDRRVGWGIIHQSPFPCMVQAGPNAGSDMGPSCPGLLLPSLCAVALPFVASSYVTTIVLLILIPGTSNLCDAGFIVNSLDVAPR